MTNQTQICAIEGHMTAAQKDIVRTVVTAPDMPVAALVELIAAKKGATVGVSAAAITRYRTSRDANRLVALAGLRDAIR